MENIRKHHYVNRIIITGLCPNGEYGAYDESRDDGRVRGYGHTRDAAIIDMFENNYPGIKWDKDHGLV